MLGFGFSLVDHQTDRKQSYPHGLCWISPVLKVETPAAPWPILRVRYQAANDRIGVHVVQLPAAPLAGGFPCGCRGQGYYDRVFLLLDFFIARVVCAAFLEVL